MHPRRKFGDAEKVALSTFLSLPGVNIAHEVIDGDRVRLFLDTADVREIRRSAKEFVADRSKPGAGLIEDVVSAVASEKAFGVRDGKRFYVDIDKDRRVTRRDEKRKQRLGRQKARPSADSNELPKRARNQIICGDSLAELKRLPDNCVDLILTSPPYNFGLEYETTEDARDWKAYFSQLFEVLKEASRVLKHGGRMVINVQPLFSDYIPTHHIISRKLMDWGLLWKGEILWEKNNYNCKYTAWGSWKSPSSPYLKYTWEFLEIFCKGSRKHDGDPAMIDIGRDEFIKWVYAKWTIPAEHRMAEFKHPSMFPEALAERVLKLFSYQGDVVLDMFNGAGTTTAVAKRLGRNFVGVDISKEYCRTARQRLKVATQRNLELDTVE